MDLTISASLTITLERINKVFEEPEINKMFQEFMECEAIKKQLEKDFKMIPKKMAEKYKEQEILKMIEMEYKFFMISLSVQDVFDGKSLEDFVKDFLKKELEQGVNAEVWAISISIFLGIRRRWQELVVGKEK